jgi:hypothetical protein
MLIALKIMATAGALEAWGAPANYSGQIGEASQSMMRLDTQLIGNLKTQLTSTLMSSAIEGKTLNTDSLSAAFKNAFINTGLAKGANGIGDAKQNQTLNDFTQALSHAVLGCVGGAAIQGGGCSAGAVGGVVGELTAKYATEQSGLSKDTSLKLAKIVSAASGLLIDPNSAAGVNIANTTGTNAAVNNRLLHEPEKKSIQQLANWDKEKAANLNAAACAIVRCADGIAIDDPNYPSLKKLQDSGENKMAEQILLKQQKGWNGRTYGNLFQYTFLDQYVVDPLNQNKTQILNTAADGAAFVSREAGMVGSTATAVAAYPNPFQPEAAALAITSTTIGFAADVAEQILRPDPGKLITNGATDILLKPIVDKFPVIAPISNEGAELFKNSEAAKKIIESVKNENN